MGHRHEPFYSARKPSLEGFLLLYVWFLPTVNVLTCLGEDPLPSAKPPLQKKPAAVLSMQSCWPWSPAGVKGGAETAVGGRWAETRM